MNFVWTVIIYLYNCVFESRKFWGLVLSGKIFRRKKKRPTVGEALMNPDKYPEFFVSMTPESKAIVKAMRNEEK